MKKKIEKVALVEVSFCNICKKEITNPVWDDSGAAKRIDMVNGLFKTSDFDAHEKCINTVARKVFKKFIE